VTAYLIADVHFTGDAAELGEYRSKVLATLEPYGGRYLVRGGEFKILEGVWEPGRITMVEFPDVESARAWYESSAYREIAPLRSRNTDSKLLIVNGL
jgi:uncharacterized protein (DUF1330 family)